MKVLSSCISSITISSMVICLSATVAESKTQLAAPPTVAQSLAESADSLLAGESGEADGSVIPVQNGAGGIVGYTVDVATRNSLEELSNEMISVVTPGADGTAPDMQTQNFWQVMACTAAVSAFIATTVFPTARAARLAVRIGGMVKRYGVKKVAKILTRTYKGSDVNAQAIFNQIAREAAGTGALGICFA